MRWPWRARTTPRHAGRVIMRRTESREQADLLADAFRSVLADLMAAKDVRVDVEQRPRRDGYAVWVYYTPSRAGGHHGGGHTHGDDPGPPRLPRPEVASRSRRTARHRLAAAGMARRGTPGQVRAGTRTPGSPPVTWPRPAAASDRVTGAARADLRACHRMTPLRSRSIPPDTCCGSRPIR